MNVTRDDAGLPSSLSAILRREARATRPDFSGVFQARLMDRVAVEEVSLPSPREDMSRRRCRGGLEWLAFPAGAAVALAVIVAVFATSRAPDETPPVSSLFKLAEQQGRGDVPVAGIESFPLYDDIDAGVRAGVWMLASSLVEVPDWARLADFDAPASPSDAPGP